MRSVAALLTAGVAVLTVGCASTVTGQASPAAVPPTATVDSPFVPAPPQSTGTLLEANRIAGAVAIVQATFPDRTQPCFPDGPQISTRKIDAQYFGAEQAAPVLDRAGFVAAWGQCHRTVAGQATLTLVTEVSDPGTAVRAAAELTGRAVTPTTTPAPSGTPDTVPAEPATLPGTGIAASLQRGPLTDTVQAWIPSGRMLAYVFHESPPGQGVTDADRFAADQRQLLSTFAPTPQAAVADLPTDPDALQRRALKPPGTLGGILGPFDLEGYLRFALNPARERDVLTANGFVGMYAKSSTDADLSYAVNLYGFPDSTRTNAAYTAFAQLETAAFSGTPFTLRTVPKAPCFVFPRSDRFYQRCYVGYGRYLAGVDVAGLTSATDTAVMNRLLPAQQKLISS